MPEASSTAEVVWDLMHDLGVAADARVAEGLYVGLVTDTGRFMYKNTGVRAHEMAAELVAAGVNVHEMFRRLYEGMPSPRWRCWRARSTSWSASTAAGSRT